MTVREMMHHIPFRIDMKRLARSLESGEPCRIDEHGICRTHDDEPCHSIGGRFVCQYGVQS